MATAVPKTVFHIRVGVPRTGEPIARIVGVDSVGTASQPHLQISLGFDNSDSNDVPTSLPNPDLTNDFIGNKADHKVTSSNCVMELDSVFENLSFPAQSSQSNSV